MRNTATFNFSGNFEVQKAAPLDNKFLVDKKENLYKKENWLSSDGNDYTYVGMIVSCLDTPGTLFQLINKDYTQSSSWATVGDADNLNSLDSKIQANTSNISSHTSDTSNPHKVTKEQLGLGNVDNTSDSDKPISTATQDALDGKVSKSGDTMTGTLVVNDLSSDVTINITGKTGVNLTHGDKTVLKTIDNGSSYGICLSGLETSVLSEDRPLFMVRSSDGYLLKTSNITVNNSTGTINAKDVKTKTVTASDYGTFSGLKLSKLPSTTADITDDNIIFKGVSTDDGSPFNSTGAELINIGIDYNSYRLVSQLAMPYNGFTAQSNNEILKIRSYHNQSGWSDWHNIPATDLNNTFTGSNNFTGNLQINGVNVATVNDAVTIDNLTIIKNSKEALQVNSEALDIKTEGVTTTDKILVKGGPLASLLNNAGITEISKGQDLQALLTSLFTQELWGSEKFTEGTLSASISAPSFTVSNTLVEVGSTVTVGACAAPTTSYSSSNRSVSGLTYGYSSDNSTINSSTSITKSVSNVTKGGTVSLTRTGLGSTETGSSLASTTYTATEGSVTITVSVTGQTVSGTFEEIPSVWICSNLGNMSNSYKTTAHTAVTKTTSAPTNKTSKTITAVYPFYATSSSIDTLTKQTLTTSKTYEISMPSETSADKHSFATNKTISSVQIYDTVSETYVSYPISNFTTSTVQLSSGGTNISCTRYTRNDGTNGPNKFKITIA